MRIADLDEAIAAAKDFLRTAEKVKQIDAATRRADSTQRHWPEVRTSGCRVNGLLRARSVVLSQALIELRR